ncbi:MAG TPA: flagellar basal body rod protein FlgC [Fimbriimonadaceae bacterium]|nr:flagellar basal body rod protein FlgC [Fimbriimonadaceae bacterium]
MTLSQAMRASSTGMTAERFRMDVISTNIANANSIQTTDHDAYRRQVVILSGNDRGVRIERLANDMSELRRESEPGNPNADKDGFVYYSNVKPINEMVNMISATRAYEANVAAFNSSKGMLRSALTIGDV